MPFTIKPIAWSLLGAILGFALIYGGFEIYFRVFELVPVDDANEIRSWQSFNSIMMGVAGAGVGFFAGFVFGLVWTRKAVDNGSA